MGNNVRKDVLFMDFDGVICDSFQECLESAYEVYFNLNAGSRRSKIDEDVVRKGAEIRPFVLSGEEFYYIPYAIENGYQISNQFEFDALKKSMKSDHDRISKEFYRIRDYKKLNETSAWLSANKLYQGMKYHLPALIEHWDFYIVTTKDESSVVRILTYNDIRLCQSRIKGKRVGKSKNTIINEILKVSGKDKGYFIDDSIQNLGSIRNDNVECFLAEWGYVDRSSISLSGATHFQILSLNQFFDRFLQGVEA